MEPGDINNDDISQQPPTREEIIKKIEDHFKRHLRDMEAITPDDIEILADNVVEAFKELECVPLKRSHQIKPYMTITLYLSEYSLYERERIPGKYSTLNVKLIQCSKIDFQMTVVRAARWVSLAYVSKNYWL